ncbi:VOC family protein [Methylomicrobium lacus]|uniref:VOC family protein n=1 Tax=Methylomicrobium lacus TaxID=136992 RepID=UPI0035A8B09A
MLRSHIDHIVITAPSLEVGVEYVRQTLGVIPQVGGEHPRMGTHNSVLKLGEKRYLEVIAINPNALQPDRPRWFRLDDPDASEPIRLATWIAHTNDIHAAATASPIPLGEVESMSRGQMNWLITLPADGSLPLQGIAPTLIQWPPGVHPAATLPESGCTLVRLEGFHPEAEKVVRMLEFIGFEGAFRVSPLPLDQKPYLVAHIQTPKGVRQLSASF